MKQTKKNKINQSVIWPTSVYFTLKQLFALNSGFKEITLRVRLANAIGEGKVAEIGSIPGGQGRPPKVYVMTPVTQLALDKAEQDGITVPGESKRLVNVATVSTPKQLAPYITSVI